MPFWDLAFTFYPSMLMLFLYSSLLLWTRFLFLYSSFLNFRSLKSSWFNQVGLLLHFLSSLCIGIVFSCAFIIVSAVNRSVSWVLSPLDLLPQDPTYQFSDLTEVCFLEICCLCRLISLLPFLKTGILISSCARCQQQLFHVLKGIRVL